MNRRVEPVGGSLVLGLVIIRSPWSYLDLISRGMGSVDDASD